MKRLMVLFMMLFLAACGGGGTDSSSAPTGVKTTASEATVTVDFNKVAGKSVASVATTPFNFDDPAWVRVVFRNFTDTATPVENTAQKQIFDVQLGSKPSFRLPADTDPTKPTFWKVDAIYFSEDGSLRRMQHYGKYDKLIVDPNTAASIVINMNPVTTSVNMPLTATGAAIANNEIKAGDQFGVRAAVDADFYDGNATPGLLLDQKWSFAVRQSPITTPIHLAHAPVADYINTNAVSGLNFVPDSEAYGQGEFFINPAFLKRGENQLAWTYHVNTGMVKVVPADVYNVNNVETGVSGSLFDDTFPPKMTSLVVSTFQNNPTGAIQLTAAASDNIGTTAYCVKAVKVSAVNGVFPSADAAPADAPTAATCDTGWQTAQPLTYNFTSEVTDGANNFLYLYVWAKDGVVGQGNVSKTYKASPLVTFNNTPQVMKFSVQSPVHKDLATTPYRINVTDLVGSVGVTKYLVSLDNNKVAADITSTSPTPYIDYPTALTEHDNFVKVYGYVNNGKAIAKAEAIVNITDRPVVNFTVPTTVITNHVVPVVIGEPETFNAVSPEIKYAITKTSTPPASSAFTSTKPVQYDIPADFSTSNHLTSMSIYVWVSSNGLISLPNFKNVLVKIP